MEGVWLDNNSSKPQTTHYGGSMVELAGNLLCLLLEGTKAKYYDHITRGCLEYTIYTIKVVYCLYYIVVSKRSLLTRVLILCRFLALHGEYIPKVYVSFIHDFLVLNRVLSTPRDAQREEHTYISSSRPIS